MKPAAFAARLEAEGLGGCVDMWGGSSSGGINMAFAAAGCMGLGVEAYLEALGPRGFFNDGRSRRFIDIWRFGRGQVMDVEGMVEVVFRQVKRLNFAALAASPVPVWVTATERGGALRVLRLDGRGEAEVCAALKDTGRIPWVGHPVGDASVLWDGGLAPHANMPLDVARELGATHVLALCAGDGRSSTPGKALLDRLVGLAMGRRMPELRRALRARYAWGEEVEARLRGDPTVLPVLLEGYHLASGEQNTAKMRAAALAAWAHMGEVLGLPPLAAPQRWQG